MLYSSDSGKRAVQERYRHFLDRWPVPGEQVIVPTRQGDTFVISCGPPDAPPLVLLHGSVTNSAIWLGDVTAYARNFRVHAVDIIGEPGLSAPSRPPMESDAYARWLQDVLDFLRIRRASFVAVSLGAWMALDYATRCPGNVDRLALLAPSGLGPQRFGMLLLALMVKPFGRRGRRKAMRMLLGTPAFLPSGRPGRPEGSDAVSAGDLGAFMLLINGTFRPRRGRVPLFGDEALRRLTMPVMVIAGARDALLDSRATRDRLARAVPHATVHLLPGAGHHLPGQTDRVLDFLLEKAHA